MRALRIIWGGFAVVGIATVCVLLRHEMAAVVALPASSGFRMAWQEKGRVASPSGKCEIVTYEGNAGAMTSFEYLCFVVKPGAKVDPDHYGDNKPVLSSSDAMPKLQWLSYDRLAVDTAGGEVWEERPYVWNDKLTVVFSNAPWPTSWVNR
jgi:hypothetical protein